MAQNQNNYFSNTIRRYNTDDFVRFLKPEQIQKSAKERIFREMVRGQIDYVEYGKYFVDSKFLENLIIAADNELTNNNTIYNALRYYDLNFPGQIVVIHNITRFSGLCFIFDNLLQRLNNVKVSSNIGHLADIQYVLSNYRNYI